MGYEGGVLISSESRGESLPRAATLSWYDGGGGGSPLTGDDSTDDWYSWKLGGGWRLRGASP